MEPIELSSRLCCCPLFFYVFVVSTTLGFPLCFGLDLCCQVVGAVIVRLWHQCSSLYLVCLMSAGNYRAIVAVVAACGLKCFGHSSNIFCFINMLSV